MTTITASDIDAAALLARVQDPRAGAVVTFAGVVRNHDHGAAVTGIEYVAHPSAEQVMRQLIDEFAARDGVHGVTAQHRVGTLGVGGMALFVAVSASHRQQAFECAWGLVDRVKEVLPVWKKQFLADGGYEWSQCP